MRLTDFWDRMAQVFGAAYAHSWAKDVVLEALGCTVDEAIAKGVETKEIWRAVCAQVNVPSQLT